MLVAKKGGRQMGGKNFGPCVMKWRQEVRCADRLKKRQMYFSRTLCETCVTDSRRPAHVRCLQVGQRVGGARYMCEV